MGLKAKGQFVSPAHTCAGYCLV